MGELTWQQVCDSERETLLRYLDKMRAAIIRATEGLDDEQLPTARRAVGDEPPGPRAPLTGVEQHWFQYVFAGSRRRGGHGDDGAGGCLGMPTIVARYRAVCSRHNEIVRDCDDLSTMAARPNPGEDDLDSLRVVTAHLLEETARHAGHADILREQIDGRLDDE